MRLTCEQRRLANRKRRRLTRPRKLLRTGIRVKSAKNFRNSLLLALALLCAGCCGTVTPVTVTSNTASFDGNTQNSGFIGWATNGAAIITLHGEARYEALIALYGKGFRPPLVRGEGVIATTTNTFIMDQEHTVKFATMNRWLKEGKPPVK